MSVDFADLTAHAWAIIRGRQCTESACQCHLAAPGKGLVHCPGHNDEHPSLSVRVGTKRVLLNDFGGHCLFDTITEALRRDGLWPEKRMSVLSSVKRVPVSHPQGLTVETLERAKRLPPGFLASLGIRNVRRHGAPAVRIPYRDTEGREISTRYRLALNKTKEGDRRFDCPRGTRSILYGLDRLAAIREAGWVLLVEGESDTWTGWQHGVPVLGIPGKSIWKSDWAALLKDLDCYLWQEPEAEDLTERVVADVPGLRLVFAPQGCKDLSDVHVAGDQVPQLVSRLRAQAHLAAEVVRERHDARLADLRRRATPVLSADDPLRLVKAAVRDCGYGGDADAPLLIYLGATTRVLGMRRGAMPSHMNVVGPPGMGKNYALGSVLALLPSEAYHLVHAASPRTLIYDTADLRHRVIVFGEADSLPAGEDNPAASAIRNLLQDHRLHYQVTERDKESGTYAVRTVDKPGPSVLITTATRRLGEQLDSRLFTVEVPDDQTQIREALKTQADLEVKGASAPPKELVAFQAFLQTRAPWDVVVPFAPALAEAIGKTPASSRVMRDFSRLLALVKAVAVLRHVHRQRDGGRLVATKEDYETVYELVRDVYNASLTGVGAKVRRVVDAVAALAKTGQDSISVTAVAKHLTLVKRTASRHVKTALDGGWLLNMETRDGLPYRLTLGDPLPAEEGLPSPDNLTWDTGTGVTDGISAPVVGEVKEVTI